MYLREQSRKKKRQNLENTFYQVIRFLHSTDDVGNVGYGTVGLWVVLEWLTDCLNIETIFYKNGLTMVFKPQISFL